MTPKPTLHRFQQGLSQEYDISTSTFEIKGSNSRIIHLDTFWGPDDEGASAIHLLAIYDDGQIRCFSENLEREEWATNISSGSGSKNSQEKVQVEYASVVSLDKARRAILKGRDDLVSTVERKQADPSILVLITRALGGEDKTLKLRLLNIGSSNEGSTNLFREPSRALEPLATTNIPQPNHAIENTTRLFFHIASGTLYQTEGPILRMCSVTGMIVLLERTVYLGYDRASSFLRLSRSLIVDATPSSVFIFDLNYSSIQARYTLDNPSVAPDSTSSQKINKKKQKEPAQSNIRLLSYFHQLNVAVAIKGRHLITFQFDSTAVRDSSNSMRKRKRDSLLIDSIGCGSVSTEKRRAYYQPRRIALGRALRAYDEHDEWNKQKVLLEDYLAKHKQAKFESLMSSHIQVDGFVDQSNASKSSTLDRRKTNYLLSRIFSVENKRPTSLETSIKTLEVSNYFPGLCDFLIREGLFASREVETALKHESLLSFDDNLDATAVCEALARHDPSLQTVLSMVHSPAPLTAKDIVCALRISLRQRTDGSLRPDTNLLTHGEEVIQAASKSPKGCNNALYKNTVSHPAHANNQKAAYQIFLTAIRRLYDSPSRSVSAALTQLLSRSDMQYLVDMLRLELARNGWLTPYIENELHVMVEDRPESAQVCIIAHILNSVIDAIGTAGWLLGSWAGEDLAETADTLAYMNAEISAALEGIEEASYLKNMIGEVLVCGKNFGTIKSKSSHQLASKIPTKPRKSAIVSWTSREEAALPLGLKPPQTISTHRVRSGGELIKRSARDIGRLKSKMVPKYSFERIRF